MDKKRLLQKGPLDLWRTYSVEQTRWLFGMFFANMQVQVITLSFAVNCPGKTFHCSALKGLPISRGATRFS